MRFGRVFVLLIAALFLCASAPAVPSARHSGWCKRDRKLAKCTCSVRCIYCVTASNGARPNSKRGNATEPRSLFRDRIKSNRPGLCAATSLLKLGYDRAHPLSTKLSKSDLVQLQTVMSRDGLGDESRFENMQPWLVASATPSVADGALRDTLRATERTYRFEKNSFDAGKPVARSRNDRHANTHLCRHVASRIKS